MDTSDASGSQASNSRMPSADSPTTTRSRKAPPVMPKLLIMLLAIFVQAIDLIEAVSYTHLTLPTIYSV